MQKSIYIIVLLLSALASVPASAAPAPANPVAVSTLGPGPGFTLNPNPVTGSFFYVNLEFTESEFPHARIAITNVLGQVVYNAPIRKTEFATGKIRIELSDAKLDKGVYFVQVSSGENTKTLKLAVR